MKLNDSSEPNLIIRLVMPAQKKKQTIKSRIRVFLFLFKFLYFVFATGYCFCLASEQTL